MLPFLENENQNPIDISDELKINQDQNLASNKNIM